MSVLIVLFINALAINGSFNWIFPKYISTKITSYLIEYVRDGSIGTAYDRQFSSIKIDKVTYEVIYRQLHEIQIYRYLNSLGDYMDTDKEVITKEYLFISKLGKNRFIPYVIGSALLRTDYTKRYHYGGKYLSKADILTMDKIRYYTGKTVHERNITLSGDNY